MKKHTIIIAIMVLATTIAGYAQKHNDMEEQYYFATTVKGELEDVKQKTEEVFKEQGFGLISELAMHEKLMEKLDDIDMQPYYIMGFCNPGYAYQTLQVEENIGLFLPCKVIIRQNDEGSIDVVAINPEKAMQAIANPGLEKIAGEVTQKFKAAIEAMPEEVK